MKCDPATALFVIADGQVKTSLVTLDGDEVIFDITTAGGVLGEPGLFARERNRAVDMIAMQATIVLEIGRETVIDFLMRHPPAMMPHARGSGRGDPGQR
jgi:CRP-like cAMP-binding protein